MKISDLFKYKKCCVAHFLALLEWNSVQCYVVCNESILCDI